MSSGEPANGHSWNPRSRVFVAGHGGLIGAALVRALTEAGHQAVITVARADLDLTSQHAVEDLFSREQPQYVVLAAGRCVSTMEEAQYPADVLRDHLTIQANVIDSAYSFGARKLIFPATFGALACPSGRLLDRVRASGASMCSAYRSQFGFRTLVAVVPTIYGPHDRFGPKRPESIPGYMYALRRAVMLGWPSVRLPGDPDASTEFLHADDLARALLLLLQDEAREEVALVPAGSSTSVRELVSEIAAIAGYRGDVDYDGTSSLPAPAPYRCSAFLQSQGWRPLVSLSDGLRRTYSWFLDNQQRLRL